MFKPVFSYVGKEFGGIDELIEGFVVDVVDLVFVANPPNMSLVDKDDVFTDTHDRIHVVSVDYGGDAVFMGDVAEQFVDYD